MLGSKYWDQLSEKGSTTALLRRLLVEQAAAQWKLYTMTFVCMAIAAAATGLSAYLLGDVINQAYVERSLAGIVALALLAAFVFMVKAAATYGHTLIMSWISNRIIAENQRRMFESLIRQNLAYFADRHSSEFMARLNAGATSASNVLNLLAGALGRDFLSVVALVIVMVLQDPWMSLVSLVVVPPALFMLRKMVRRIYHIALSQFVGGARLLESLQETVQGVRTVKTFTLEDEMRARVHSNIAELEKESNRWARVAHRASPLMEALGGLAVALAMIYGGYRVVETGAAPGQFFSFLAAFLLAYEPAKRLARLNIELNSNMVGVRVLFDIIDAPPSEPKDDQKPPLNVSAGRIEFKDVRFGYRPEEPVLRGMSFVANPGNMTALVGQSGGGKSTVLNLVLRLYEPESGTVSIDGQNVVEVSRASLRMQVAYVGQDVFLFHGTIRDNIAIGKPGATEAEIVAAAKAAHAHEFVSAFPEGYQTMVGERGAKLSGGERQRVAIARALVKDAPIILLDEATASLDSESERLVQDAMVHLCENRTTLVIAHRLHTITHADRILVVENGVIAEAGRHDELLRKGGRYAAFYRLQIREQGADAPIAIASNA
ncbi:MAG: ABC transporter ATP-binding protein [Xanthobacteraceae bacterium]|jgi:ATP-binding cassette, subfamily B, bacterial MsbA